MFQTTDQKYDYILNGLNKLICRVYQCVRHEFKFSYGAFSRLAQISDSSPCFQDQEEGVLLQTNVNPP